MIYFLHLMQKKKKKSQNATVLQKEFNPRTLGNLPGVVGTNFLTHTYKPASKNDMYSLRYLKSM
jgi:hypothetical protein